MKKIVQLAKLSSRYWRSHFKRILTFAIIIIIGTAALCASALLVRSEKEIELEKMLISSGNYDASYYEMNEKDISYLANNEEVKAYGYYNELGYGSVDSGPTYKVASFADLISEDLYHVGCTIGNYPRSKDEVAIDAKTAKDMGIIPSIGQEVSLTLYDLESNKLTTKEYRLSGIFEVAYNGDYEGYYRGPEYIKDGVLVDGEYTVPTIFLSKEERSIYPGKLVSSFIQTDADAYEITKNLEADGFEAYKYIGPYNMRAFAYAYIVGGGFVGWFGSDGNLGELPTLSNVSQFIKDGKEVKDFYSSILVPIFSLLIMVVVMVSIYSLVRNLLLDRAEQIAILRSLGMTKYSSILYLFIELLLLSALFIVIGMVIGLALHYGMVTVTNTLFDLKLPLGFQVSEYVAVVTTSPYLYAFVVIELSCFIALLIPLIKMLQLTPVAIFQKRLFINNKYRKRHYTTFHKRSWRKVLKKNLRFYDVPVMIITIIVISAAFFGYNYFRVHADKDNAVYQNMLEQEGMKTWDYVAKKSSHILPFEYNIENQHKAGINKESYEAFANNDYIESSFARIVNNSTRLSYKTGQSQEIGDLLGQYTVRSSPASEDEFENSLHEAEEAALNAIGYSSEEEVYTLPTIGLLDKELEELSSYVKQGSINLDKIKTGEEIILTVPSHMEEQALKCYKVGDSLPLSDVALSEEEDEYDFAGISYRDFLEPVYKKDVVEPDSSTVVPLTSYAVGQRKEIPTKIGAIVVLTDITLLRKYCLPSNDVEYSETSSELTYEEIERMSYGLSLNCLPDTFKCWGLPDEHFTEARFFLKEGASVKEADADWYKIISDNKKVTYKSSSEIRQSIKKNTTSIMAIYYLMVILLVVVGVLAIGIKFYSKIKMKSQSIARLRATGMSLPQIQWLIISQNVKYPIIGAFIALIPTALCQGLFDYIKHQVDTGVWEGAFLIGPGEMPPWWSMLPFRFNLFGYHPVITLLILIVTMFALTLLATVPQILYMKKQVIAENYDNDTF